MKIKELLDLIDEENSTLSFNIHIYDKTSYDVYSDNKDSIIYIVGDYILDDTEPSIYLNYDKDEDAIVIDLYIKKE